MLILLTNLLTKNRKTMYWIYRRTKKRCLKPDRVIQVVEEKLHHQRGCDEGKKMVLPLRERLHVPSVNDTGKQVTLKRGGHDI